MRHFVSEYLFISQFIVYLAFFWGACYPLDTLKTVVQTSHVAPTIAAKEIFKKSGISGFYRGLLPCLLRAFPANGVVFVVVDFVQKIFLKQRN